VKILPVRGLVPAFWKPPVILKMVPKAGYECMYTRRKSKIENRVEQFLEFKGASRNFLFTFLLNKAR
jgi:hypothetical protein